MIIKRAITLVLALGLSVAGAAACGNEPGGGTTASASPKPATNGIDAMASAKAMTTARDAFLKAPSVRIKGTFTDGGSKITLDLRQAAGGSSGTFVIDGAKLNILTVGKTAYIKADRKFWESQGVGEAYATFKGKWLKTSLSAADFKDMAALTDREEFAKQLPAGSGLHGKPQTIRGTPAYEFKDADGSSYFVALQGEPYPLKVTSKDPADPGQFEFLDYGKPVDLAPPPASKVIKVPS